MTKDDIGRFKRLKITGESEQENIKSKSVSTEKQSVTKSSTVAGEIEAGKVTESDKFISAGYRGVDDVPNSGSEIMGTSVATNGVTAVMGGTIGLSVFDVTSGTPKYRGVSPNTNTKPFGVELDAGVCVCANYNTDTVTLVDVSDQTAPSVLDTIGTGAQPTVEGVRYLALDRESKVAYVSASKNTNDGLTAIDYSGRSLSVLWSVTGTEFVRSFHVATAPNWPVVYVAAEDGSDQIVVVDKSSQSVTNTVSTANTDGAFGVELNAVREELYLTANDSGSFAVFDVSDPSTPSEVGAVTDGDLQNAYGFAEAGDYAYVAAKSADAYSIIDKSDPASPTLVTSVTQTDHSEINQPYDVAISQGGTFMSNRGTNSLISFGGRDKQPYNGYTYVSNGTTSVAGDATETIPFDQVTRNDGDIVDTATHEWTIPSDGIWEFDISVRINDLPDGERVTIAMVRNGNDEQHKKAGSGTETINGPSVTFGRDLNAGDTIKFTLLNSSASSISIQGNSGPDNTWCVWGRDDV